MNDTTRNPRPQAGLHGGRLEGIGVPDLLWTIWRGRNTGVLSITAGGCTKRVFVEGGRIVFAASEDPNDRLGEMLLREGAINLDQLESAVARLDGRKRLGTILVEAGHLSPDGLVKGVLGQVRRIVLGLFPLEEGDYRFVDGPLESDELIKLGMKTAEILLEGVRQIRSFSRIRRSVGSTHTRYRLDDDGLTALRGLDVRDGERLLVQRIGDAGARGVSVDALCREVFLSNFEIYRALWAYAVLGVIHPVGREVETSSASAMEGSLERAGGLPELLVRLCRDGETGVLNVSRGAIERTFHIKEGSCVFATSSSIDDGLVAHLLRRGVISLKNCEETARKLLSNKRVGTILLEMGVIDESDLRATMREQLLEIIFDTFCWETGDYQFASGELPTIEQITLDRTVESLVFDGVRRVTSWSRVCGGCGGAGARMSLRPEYLSVLDRMSVGSDEWELVSILRTPKTLEEICRESLLGSFRSCQILWALRLLGAIGPAPAESGTKPDASESRTTGGEAGDTPNSETAPRGVAGPAPEPAPDPEPVFATELEALPVSEPGPEPAPEPEPVFATEIEALPVSESAPEPEPEPEPEERREPEADPMPVPLATVEEETTIARTWEIVGTLEPDGRPTLPASETVGSASADDDAIEIVDHGETHPGARDEEPAGAAAGAAVGAREDAGRTMRIPREEIEAALQASEHEIIPDRPPLPRVEEHAEALPAMPPEPPFDPPAGLEGAIARFNARHVILYKALRTEVGAGAANFVRSCRSSLGHDGAILATAELNPDGSWDPIEIRRSVIEHRISDAEMGFQKLLSQEVEMLRLHLGASRVGKLMAQLASIA